MGKGGKGRRGKERGCTCFGFWSLLRDAPYRVPVATVATMEIARIRGRMRGGEEEEIGGEGRVGIAVGGMRER